MQDTKLRQDVIDELEFEPSIEAASIGVTAKDGVVTLSGHVTSYAEKIAAERATRRVKGVRAIAQEIEVRYPGSARTADDEIATRALNALKWIAAVPHEDIKVTVNHGLVTLSGEVAWHYQSDAAENAVRGLIGVTGVANSIALKPQARAVDVKKKIEDALRRHAEVEAKSIRVNVINDKVTLEGTVDNWDERMAVENAAWSAPGVRMVEDRLRIGA